MTRVGLRFPAGCFQLDAPEEAVAELGLLYDRSVLAATPEPDALLGRYRLAPGRRGWRLEEVGAERPLGDFAAPAFALLELERALEERLLAARGDRLALHAGAVVVDGGACLLAGRADCGKSSTTLQMVELGHDFLAEEIAFVDPASGGVEPHLQSLALDPAVVEELAAERPIRRGRLERLDDLLWRYAPARVAGAPAPLAALLLPRHRPGAPPRLRRERLEERLTEILGYCFEPLDDPEPLIDRLIELLRGVRLLRLDYPDAGAARRLLAAEFGEPGTAAPC